MTTHSTKGIVLRTVAYGDTSLIAQVYTELFGVQSYMIKGIRKASKKGSHKAIYFQPAAILEMEVYHNEFKSLQFIKSFDWGYTYQHIFFDVVRNAVALYMVELLQHSLKQPEANPELFYLMHDSLVHADKTDTATLANLPLYFTLHLAAELGFEIQGQYSTQTPILDLMEGCFTTKAPVHQHYLAVNESAIISNIQNIHFYEALATIKLNQATRRQLLEALQQYLALHVADFGTIKSLHILQAVLS
jgi:DNA repair protein RecO (recombination protein O)